MPTFTTYYNLAKPLVNDPIDEDLWGNELNDDLDIIDSTMHTLSLNVGVPIGGVLPYAGSTAPTNFLLCYGQAISRVTYADLFTVTGTTYGVGDGSTTFNLPDLRGRVGAGKDDMGGVSANRLTGLSGGVDGDILGGTGGSQSHVLTTAQLAAHTHGITGTVALNNAGNTSIKIQAPEGASATVQSDSIGSDEAHNNVQPTIILSYIIRAT